MYRPRAFAVDDEHTIKAFIAAHPFAILTGPGAAVTHLPVLQHGDDELMFHLARPNPHCDALAAGGDAIAVFTGPHGYVSPRWYAEPGAVPTWNYAAVHARGPVREVTDPERLRAGIEAMVEKFEPEPDIVEIVTPATISGMLRGIRCFTLRIEHLEGKFKMSQNRSAADRAGVISGLADGTSEDQALARLMVSVLAS